MSRAAYMVYENAIRFIQHQADAASGWLSAQPSGPMGITLDSVKCTAEWQAKHAEYHSLTRQIKSIRTLCNKELGTSVCNRIARELIAEKRTGA